MKNFKCTYIFDTSVINFLVAGMALAIITIVKKTEDSDIWAEFSEAFSSRVRSPAGMGLHGSVSLLPHLLAL